MSNKHLLVSLFFSSTLLLSKASGIETGDDLKLDPDKYTGKKVTLIGMIDANYQPLKAPNGSGNFYVMDTGKNVRESYGSTTRTVFRNEGEVVVFVPNSKVSSFVTTYKHNLSNYSAAGKGFSGIYLKRDETQNSDEWRGWWYWYGYHKGYYVDLTGGS
jgi:hypothetical protein